MSEQIFTPGLGVIDPNLRNRLTISLRLVRTANMPARTPLCQATPSQKSSHEASDNTFCSPRVVRNLIDAGLSCSDNSVARLMKEVGIRARHRPCRALDRLPSQCMLSRRICWTGNLRRLVGIKKFAADFTYAWAGQGCSFSSKACPGRGRRLAEAINECLVSQR